MTVSFAFLRDDKKSHFQLCPAVAAGSAITATASSNAVSQKRRVKCEDDDFMILRYSGLISRCYAA